MSEDTTKIGKLECLLFKPMIFYIVVPILSILTAFILPLVLFWYPKFRVKVYYKKVKNNPSHILVTGILGNIEIVKIQNNTINYRLINYKYKKGKFQPVILNVKKSH
jgi:hypothetical protein